MEEDGTEPRPDIIAGQGGIGGGREEGERGGEGDGEGEEGMTRRVREEGKGETG